MNWVLVATPRLMRGAAVAAERAGIERVIALGDPITAADGVVVHGSDHDLALIAGRTEAPLLLDPANGSDLMRMFGPQASLPERIASGSPYPADLGVARGASVSHPFVAHAVYSRSGRLPSGMARRRAIALRLDDRDTEAEAAAVAILNAQHVEGDRMGPRSALMDGTLDVHVFSGGARSRIASRRRRRLGLQRRSDGIVRRSAGSIGLGAVRSWRLAVDGIRVGAGPWEIAVEPGAYFLWA